jgi:hypothetical protein
VAKVISFRNPFFEEILGSIQGANEENGDERHDGAEGEVGRQQCRSRDLGHVERGHRERRMNPEEKVTHVGRRGGCQGDGDERSYADFVQEHFDSEEHAADRGVERGGDSSAAPRSDERGQLPPRDACRLACP